jgi:hypothetical protein
VSDDTSTINASVFQALLLGERRGESMPASTPSRRLTTRLALAPRMPPRPSGRRPGVFGGLSKPSLARTGQSKGKDFSHCSPGGTGAGLDERRCGEPGNFTWTQKTTSAGKGARPMEITFAAKG